VGVELETLANPRPILGKIGGLPHWIQATERVVCACGAEMAFVVQIEGIASPDLNPGGSGVLYAVVCTACKGRARILMEC
jgi:hypothetical protein